MDEWLDGWKDESVPAGVWEPRTVDDRGVDGWVERWVSGGQVVNE